MTTGNETMRPVRRPGTSSVARRLGQIPAECALAEPRFNSRANRFGRPLRYSQRRYASCSFTSPPPPEPLGARVADVDRPAPAAGDLDLAWSGLLGHRDRDRQHTVFVAGCDAFGLEVLTQIE